MRSIALTLIWGLIAPLTGLALPDGGVVDSSPEGRGVFEVRVAESLDGGSLGPGWWLSRDRMQKTGARLSDLENSLQACESERDAAVSRPSVTLPWGFWAGAALGAISMGVAVYAVGRVTQK